MHFLTRRQWRRACQWLQRDLAVGSGSGDVYANSGTTLCAALLVGYRLTIANVGDSGCLRISRLLKPASGSQTTSSSSSGDGVCDATVPDRRVAGRGTVETGGETGGASERRLVVQQLSRDHKPEREGELERIRAAGGKVVPLPNRGLGGGGGRGPGRRARAQCTALRPEQARAYRDEAVARDFREEVQRVWRADGHGPGLAMSRSLGDKVRKCLAFCPKPNWKSTLVFFLNILVCKSRPEHVPSIAFTGLVYSPFRKPSPDLTNTSTDRIPVVFLKRIRIYHTLLLFHSLFR